MSAGLFTAAQDVADAVLYEGYLLYPYRASSTKNQLRWQFGVLMPPVAADPDAGEFATMQTECLLEADAASSVHVRVRFLQVQERIVQARGPDGDFRPVAALTVGDVDISAWDETVECEVDATAAITELLDAEQVREFRIAGGEETEDVEGGRIVRLRRECTGRIRLRCRELPGPYGGYRLRVAVHNTSDWKDSAAGRDDALRRALVAAHTLLAADGGTFLSLVDPPEWASAAAKECRNTRTWPVLVGADGGVVLSAPIILYDHPAIAPESAGALYDSTEIDEILTLRTMALTDAEKREARGTDPHARAVIDRVDQMPPELLDRLHGTVRYLRSVTGEPEPIAVPDVPWWDPAADASVAPESDSVQIAGVAVRRGSAVILRPGARGSDAQDMFLAGRTATVEAVLLDVDGGCHVAVTVDADPAAEMQTQHGRFRYFSPDELEPVPSRARS